MGALDYILDHLGIGAAAAPPAPGAERMKHYPTADDVSFERQSAALGYGTGNENFIAGDAAHVLGQLGQPPAKKQKPPANPMSAIGMTLASATDPAWGLLMRPADPFKQSVPFPDTATAYGQAQIAIRRSPLAQLGYDPEKINLDVVDPKLTMAGGYSPGTDGSFALLAHPSSMVHESIHRGIAKLREQGLIPKELESRLPDEESVVRYIMALHMGDPEKGMGDVGDAQRAKALNYFRRDTQDPQKAYWDFASGPAYQGRQALNQLNDIAAKHLQATRPAGHR